MEKLNVGQASKEQCIYRVLWKSLLNRKKNLIFFSSYIGHVTRLLCDRWSCIKGREKSIFFFFKITLHVPKLLDGYTSLKTAIFLLQLVIGAVVFSFPRPWQSLFAWGICSIFSAQYNSESLYRNIETDKKQIFSD